MTDKISELMSESRKLEAVEIRKIVVKHIEAIEVNRCDKSSWIGRSMEEFALRNLRSVLEAIDERIGR